MSDRAPSDAIGYVAVHLPELGCWQGFFVLPALRQRGEALLAEARRAGGGQATGDGLPGLSSGDQAAVGALSATLAKLYSLAVADPRPPADRMAAIRSAIGAAVFALHRVTNSSWLLVVGWRDERDPRGLQTRVERIEPTTLAEARDAIVAAIDREQSTWGVIEGFTDLVGGRVRPRQQG